MDQTESETDSLPFKILIITAKLIQSTSRRYWRVPRLAKRKRYREYEMDFCCSVKSCLSFKWIVIVVTTSFICNWKQKSIWLKLANKKHFDLILKMKEGAKLLLKVKTIYFWSRFEEQASVCCCMWLFLDFKKENLCNILWHSGYVQKRVNEYVGQF